MAWIFGRVLAAFVLLLPLAEVAADSALADTREDAIRFLGATTSKLPDTLRCFNYETLDTWSEKGVRTQEWQKVECDADGYCIYSGITKNRTIQIKDPAAWQLDLDVVIPERDFYQVELGNDRYVARFFDMSRFEKGAGKTLERVDPVLAPKRPGVVSMMLGEVFTNCPVEEYIRRPTVDVAEFEEVTVEGNAVKRLVAVSQASDLHKSTSQSRVVWEFDAKTGYCLSSTSGDKGARREYSIKYSKSSSGITIPISITTKSAALESDRVMFVRDCTTSCTMDSNECLLSYHGFKEPEMSSTKSLATRSWFIWGNVGIVFVISGFLLRRRFANR
jgi:hypothetical protein